MTNAMQDNIARMEKELAEMKEKLKSVANIDLSEFVGKSWKNMCIFGKDKMLKTCDDYIWFNSDNREIYDELLTYTHTTLSELKVGDVFVLESRLENVEIDKFNIFIGKDSEGDCRCQFIDNNCNIEHIASTYYDDDEEKIIIIN